MNSEWFDNQVAVQDVLLAELDEQARGLFKQVSRRGCGMALIHFLIENPHLLTMEELAFHLGKLPAEVEADVFAFEQLGLARHVDVVTLSLYAVTMDSGRRQSMRDLCMWQERW
jgi:hypothetical protein